MGEMFYNARDCVRCTAGNHDLCGGGGCLCKFRLHEPLADDTLVTMNTTTENLYGIHTGDVVLIIQPGGTSSEKLTVEKILDRSDDQYIWFEAIQGIEFWIGKDFAGTVIVNGEKRHPDGTVNVPSLMTDMLTIGGAR